MFFHFWANFRFYTKIFDFWANFRFYTKIFDFWANFRFYTNFFYFWENIRFLTKIFNFWQKFSIFDKHLRFLTKIFDFWQKISIFDKNFRFLNYCKWYNIRLIVTKIEIWIRNNDLSNSKVRLFWVLGLYNVSAGPKNPASKKKPIGHPIYANPKKKLNQPESSLISQKSRKFRWTKISVYFYNFAWKVITL